MERSQSLYKNADYVSIFLGTNDFGTNRQLGAYFFKYVIWRNEARKKPAKFSKTMTLTIYQQQGRHILFRG